MLTPLQDDSVMEYNERKCCVLEAVFEFGEAAAQDVYGCLRGRGGDVGLSAVQMALLSCALKRSRRALDMLWNVLACSGSLQYALHALWGIEASPNRRYMNGTLKLPLHVLSRGCLA